jgi:hypothetical protein
MTQIRWNAERKIIKWGTETADRFVRAVLRLTDNAETELEELRIETLEGKIGITLLRPSMTITRRGLELSGTVERTPPKLDWSEEWLAVPIVGDDLATSWRVEVVEDKTGTIIDSGEPATLSQELWRRDKRGHLTREEDAMLDEWGYPRGDPVERLIIRSVDSGGRGRNRQTPRSPAPRCSLAHRWSMNPHSPPGRLSILDAPQRTRTTASKRSLRIPTHRPAG